MDNTTPTSGWERLLPLAGPAYAALLVVAAAAFPTPPGGDVVAATAPSWLAAHTGPVIGQTLVRGLAAGAFVVLALGAGAACARRSRSMSTAAVVGGALCGVLMLATQAASLAAALFVRDGGGADATRALGAAQSALLDASSLPAVLLFVSVGLAGGLPRWLSMLSLAGAPVALVDAASYRGGPLEPVSLVGLVYFLAWSVLAGVHLSRWLARHPREHHLPAVSARA